MPSTLTTWLNHRSGASKLIFSIVVGIAAYFVFPIPTEAHLVLSWDVFCISLLALTWLTFFTVSSKDIRREAQQQDSSRTYIFTISLLAALVSMFSVVQMILSGNSDTVYKTLNLVIGVGCMVLSWFLVHTVFTVRYAHLYYAKSSKSEQQHAGGLDFPKEQDSDLPDFLDFAYFSITIGMTFQVSDVEIRQRKIRRLALLHGIFSFAFNAAIIALSVNIISGIIEK